MEKGEENIGKGCFSRDLLKKFVNEKNHMEGGTSRKRNQDENVELNLGLSLNGRFGVDPKKPKILMNRSSSTTKFVLSGDNNNSNENKNEISLIMTSYLPMETEVEWRKRKELESLSRLEAKMRRIEKMKNVRVVKENEVNGNSLPSSCGSLGSGSSAVTEFESQLPIQGPIDSTDVRPVANGGSLEHKQELVAAALETTNEKPPVLSEKSAAKSAAAKEVLKKFMLNMPCVTTRDDGPNGKKIKGFLYEFKKGEDVKIVCVCHGSFLTPAEFVKHASGSDVQNPLRHIIVDPSPV